jgi:hypothetical protein
LHQQSQSDVFKSALRVLAAKPEVIVTIRWLLKLLEQPHGQAVMEPAAVRLACARLLLDSKGFRTLMVLTLTNHSAA